MDIVTTHLASTATDRYLATTHQTSHARPATLTDHDPIFAGK
jgi:hypothetical protein